MFRHIISKAKDLLHYYISQSYEKHPYFTISGSAIVAGLAIIFGRQIIITFRPFNKIKTIFNINSNNTTRIGFDNGNIVDDIYLAVTTNNIQRVQQILHKSADNINKLYYKGGETHSLLTVALVQDHDEMAKELIKLGADVTQKYKQKNNFGVELISPLELASKNLSLDVLKLIHAVDGNQILQVGGKALLKCLEYSPKNKSQANDCALWLINNGANVNEVYGTFAIKQTTLKRALMIQLPDVVDGLLKCGRFTQINYQDKSKSTVLHYVCASNANSALIKQLLKYGADPSIQDIEGNTALHCLLNNGGDIDAVKSLCSDATKNLNNNAGCTPLLVAASQQKKNIVDYLLSIGADPNAKDINGKVYSELLV